MHDLGDAALVHAVLGPRPGKVLDAPDLDRRDPADRHPPHPVAVGVPGRVADDRPPPRRTPRRGRRWDRGGCRSSRRCGVRARIARFADRTVRGDPLLVVAHHQHGPIGSRSARVEPVELLGREGPGGVARERSCRAGRCSHRADRSTCRPRSESGRGTRRGCRARRGGGRRTPRGSTPRRRRTRRPCRRSTDLPSRRRRQVPPPRSRPPRRGSSSPDTGPRRRRPAGSDRPCARRCGPPRSRRSAGRSRSPPDTTARRAVAATCAR